MTMKTPGQIARETVERLASTHAKSLSGENAVAIAIKAIEADRAQREARMEDGHSPLYWMDAHEDEHPQVYGAGTTAAIVSDDEGGVIAYSHIDSASLIVRALRAATA